jgi:hypothetical protein
MSMNTITRANLIAMMAMSTATRPRCIPMSTPTTTGITSTGTAAATSGSHDLAEELSHEGLFRSEDWIKSIRGFPFFPPYPKQTSLGICDPPSIYLDIILNFSEISSSC